MKQHVLALLTAAVLLLTGCSAVLDREYFSVQPHNAAPLDEEDPSVLRANNYQELVNALMYLVAEGQESGTVRLYLDEKKQADFLASARAEVAEEDPLGAYAVEEIDYQVHSLPDYAQVAFSIRYRRTQEQIASIVSVNGAAAIRGELKAAMAAFAPSCTLRLGYFDQDEGYIRTLARQAYYDDPISALDFPELEVEMCPDHGRQRIVELSMTYHLTPDQLNARKDEVLEALIKLQRAVPFSANRKDIRPIAAMIRRRVSFDPGIQHSTPWHALTLGRANSEGTALTFAALCQKLDIPCRVADGQKHGQPHFWNVVQTQEGWRHLDLTEPVERPPLRLDVQMADEGYSWQEDFLPRCTYTPRT